MYVYIYILIYKAKGKVIPLLALCVPDVWWRYSSTLLGPRQQKVVSGQQHAPAAISHQERIGTHFTGCWVGPRTGLVRCGKSRPHRDSIPDRPARSSVAILIELYGPYIYMYVLHIIYINMYIKDRFKRISHYFLTKIIRNIKFPPATAHVAPPTTPQSYQPNLHRIYF